MAATCECGWTGTSTQVRDGGRCPECTSKVRYDSAPLSLPRTAIVSVSQFNQRAAAALKAVDFGHFNSSERVVGGFLYQLERNQVSEKMQQAIYNIVHRYRRQITDQAVKDYAADRARGAD